MLSGKVQMCLRRRHDLYKKVTGVFHYKVNQDKQVEWLYSTTIMPINNLKTYICLSCGNKIKIKENLVVEHEQQEYLYVFLLMESVCFCLWLKLPEDWPQSHEKLCSSWIHSFSFIITVFSLSPIKIMYVFCK